MEKIDIPKTIVIKIYVSTAETKKRLRVDSSAIRKLRAIYRREGRLKNRELFWEALFPELEAIVKQQRSRPHSSFDDAYAIVTNAAKAKSAEAARIQAAVDEVFRIAPDDLTPLAGQIMGDDILEHMFDLFNTLTDFIRSYDEDSAQVLVGLQSLILAKIITGGQPSQKERASV